MRFDKSDNTVQICEGGVWVELEEVARMLGVDTERFLAWADEELRGWNDHIMDVIVDRAMDEIADIYRNEGPGDDDGGDEGDDGDGGEPIPQGARCHPRTKGLDGILRADKARHDAEEAEAEARRQAEIDARRHYLDHAEEILVAKLDAGQELTEDEIADFLDYVPNYLEEEGEDGRWARSVTTYCKTRDGRFFRVDWQRGLTEMQSNTYYFQPVEVTLHEEERTIPTIRRTWREVTDDVVLWSAGQEGVADDVDVEARLVAKLDAGETLTEDEIGEFLEWLDHFDEDEGDDGRWDRPVTTYCKTRDGRFFRVEWSKGLTEYQEDWYGNQPVEVSLTEEPVESTITVRTWTEV